MARNSEKTKKEKELVDGCLEVLRNLKCCEVEFHKPEAAGYHMRRQALQGKKCGLKYDM